VELGVDVGEILEQFTILEARRAEVPLRDLVAAGWDGSDGKKAEYEIEELVEANASVRMIRNAGYVELNDAVKLRRLGKDAKQMKMAGWPLSMLKDAGFSSTDLRLAGYSTAALGALQQQLQQKFAGEPAGIKPSLQRQNTWSIRHNLADEPTRASPETAA